MSATRGGGQVSVSRHQGDIASVGRACCDAHSGACLVLRWRIVEADKMPGYIAPAGLTSARALSSILLLLLSLFAVDVPSFADFPSSPFQLRSPACFCLS